MFHLLLQITFRNKRLFSEFYQNWSQFNANQSQYNFKCLFCSYQTNQQQSYQYEWLCIYHTENSQLFDEQKKYQMYENTYYDMNNLTVNNKNTAIEQKKNEITALNTVNQSKKNLIDIKYIHELLQLKCCIYHTSFLFSNKLHKHLCISCHYSKMKTALNKNVLCVLITSTIINQLNSITTLTSASIYVKSNVTNQFSSDDYSFWDWCYVTVNAQLSFNAVKQSICLNTECIMTFIDRQFLVNQAFYTATHCMTLFISVWELRTTIHNSYQYITVDIYLTDTDSCITVIIHKT